jgi:class 3 adenylate cyclase
VRVGVCTGASGGEHVSGDLIEVASRLQGRADRNGVVVDDPTSEATDGAFAFERLEDAVFRSRPRPAPIFTLVGGARRDRVEAARLDELPPGREEKKRVSVLFVDLFDLGAPSHTADPRDIRTTERPQYARLREEIGRMGGTVEKLIGDALMAVFGVPEERNDDAERAVHAALRIVEVVAELNEEDAWVELGVRAAVNSGEAAVALDARPDEGEGVVTGDTVNTAARLLGVAPFNGVAVGPRTYEATKDAFDYVPLAPVRLKGIPDPVPVYSAKRIRGSSHE